MIILDADNKLCTETKKTTQNFHNQLKDIKEKKEGSDGATLHPSLPDHHDSGERRHRVHGRADAEESAGADRPLHPGGHRDFRRQEQNGLHRRCSSSMQSNVLLRQEMQAGVDDQPRPTTANGKNSIIGCWVVMARVIMSRLGGEKKTGAQPLGPTERALMKKFSLRSKGEK
eukprot:TRINITY_DN19910_c0_g1_i1.p2 TRINITY_DN19910_c0_g1~~TRINITY_DN19910_c0_g1_i1.p2  ORF type:complete len:172 (+),score=30.85 TRINITY_DN19910_c0_g1_i1:165-680(+)